MMTLEMIYWFAQYYPAIAATIAFLFWLHIVVQLLTH
jgi:hypothetical protein